MQQYIYIQLLLKLYTMYSYHSQLHHLHFLIKNILLTLTYFVYKYYIVYFFNKFYINFKNKFK